jgi:hypothetical protein
MTRNLFIPAMTLALLSFAGCGYHRLDNRPRKAAWMVKGETVRVTSFTNQTANLGVEEPFRKALENRIVAASPWKLVGPGVTPRWVIQGTLERYNIVALGLNLGSTTAKGAAGSATRVEVSVVGSLKLLDGQTGAVMISRPSLTFSKQYRVDQNYASFDNRELAVLDSLADDFAESFVTQLLEGSD